MLEGPPVELQQVDRVDVCSRVERALDRGADDIGASSARASGTIW